MNRWIKGLLFACFACLLIGGGVMVAGIALGGTLDDASIVFGGFGGSALVKGDAFERATEEETLLDELLPGEALEVGFDEVDTAAYTVTQFPAAQIQNLELELKNCTLTLQNTEDEQISVAYAANGDIVLEKDGSTLELHDTRSRKEMGELETLEVILYVPQTHGFDEVDLELDAGDLQMQRLTAREFELEGGAGEVHIEELYIGKKLEAALGVGDFYVGQAWLRDVKLTCGVGVLEIADCELTGDMKVKGGVGDVVIGLNGTQTDYNYELTSGMGALEIFGSDYSTLGQKKEIDNGAVSTLTLKCGVGSMCIKKAAKN